jgi:hypothetical protein
VAKAEEGGERVDTDMSGDRIDREIANVERSLRKNAAR